MRDQRIEQYAHNMVDAVDVQPGSQVLVSGNALARPLLEQSTREIGRRGAYALLRVAFGGSLTGSLE